MPNLATKAEIDLGGLSLHEGVPVLLRRALAPLAEGEWLEVRGGASGLHEDLLMWCRKEGHHCQSSGGNDHRIQRGAR
jgi:TusA-related sulfurtransferase